MVPSEVTSKRNRVGFVLLGGECYHLPSLITSFVDRQIKKPPLHVCILVLYVKDKAR